MSVYIFSILGILMVINIANVKWATRVQDVFTIAKLLALVLIILTGVVVLIMGKTDSFAEPWEGTTTDVGDVSLALYSGLFAYAGWNFLNFVTEEMIEPFKNLPRAIYIAIPIVSFVYVLGNVGYLAVLSPKEVLNSNAVAVSFGERIYGVMAWIMPVSVALSCFGGVNGLIFTSGRLFFVGAREGHLPAFLGMIHSKRFTPTPAMLFTGIMSLLMLISSDVFALINYMSFVQWLSVGASITGMVYLRFKEPDRPRPIKFNLIIPISFLIAVVFLLVVPLYAATRDTGIGVLCVVSGIPVYIIGVCWKKKPKSVQNFIVKSTVLGQKMFDVVFQEGKTD
ncbi:large neutral amino acids transporter small subunit 2 [Lingula anatina]|uniref:Large neutral amino acids transporter small subunit 2 n=1 Tax=Lingula anatina TaxID=7574 RepID=A0A1S3JXJ3_LINAN|nr:large neutral amino acids transporter small subunit 2 [Lingula anatina]|eukprot:XP_013415032.2 large neutral amino acids transporter small subunit 2 [Lingula anatina]